MNIIGEGFPEEIIKQVDQRQKRYGSGYIQNRTPEEIVFLNANTSWCKLVSSVNITDKSVLQDESLRNIPNIENSNLASQFVLFNGTVDQSGDGINQRAGIDTTKNPLGNGKAYGIGGTEFGLRPMMGIQSAEIKHENRGSIRRANVKIKAFNKTQFDIIDALYLRLGFSILLEWGHSMYYDNNGILQKGSEINNSLAKEFLLGGITYDKFLNLIKNKRISSNGNYDAMFAKVSNFHWSFLPDGSYDITLDLVSIGDVVESFKINSYIPNPNDKTLSVDKEENTLKSDYFIIKKSNNTIGKFFSLLVDKCNKIIDPNFKSTPPTFFDKLKIIALTFGFTNDVDLSFAPKPNQLLNSVSFNDIEEYILSPTNKQDAISITFTTEQKYYYIRLGAFLQFLEQHIIYLSKPSNSEQYSPILKFDYNPNNNLIPLNDLQISTDPTICIINRPIRVTDPDIIPLDYAENFEYKNKNYGLIMNTYVNMAFILNKIQELKDNQNKTSLIDLLKNILNGINSSIGGINSLNVIIDETENLVKIIDENPFPDKNQLLIDFGLNTNSPIFELYGYNNQNAGFISNFSFTTELSPNFSTMITVGATSNNEVVGENATALSKLNNGLTDRYKEKLSYTTNYNLPTNDLSYSSTLNTNVGAAAVTGVLKTIIEKRNTSTTFEEDKESIRKIEEYINETSEIRKNYTEIYISYVEYLKELYKEKNFNIDDKDIYKDSLTNFLQLSQELINKKNELLSKKSFSPFSGFLPFNLSLTMDGLSGMKITNSFNIDSRYLPSNYPDNIEFIIKNIVHKIENNKWNTTLESYMISKGKNYIQSENNNSQGQTQSSTPSSTSTSSIKNRNACTIKTIPREKKIVPKSVIYDFFIKKQYNKSSIAGIIANLQRESSLNLNAFNSGGGGCGAYGLAQWRRGRQTKLYNYAKSINAPIDSVEAQLGYLYTEIETSQVKRIKNNPSPSNVAFIFASEFERFTGAENPNNPEVIARKNLANQIFNQLA